MKNVKSIAFLFALSAAPAFADDVPFAPCPAGTERVSGGTDSNASVEACYGTVNGCTIYTVLVEFPDGTIATKDYEEGIMPDLTVDPDNQGGYDPRFGNVLLHGLSFGGPAGTCAAQAGTKTPVWHDSGKGGPVKGG